MAVLFTFMIYLMAIEKESSSEKFDHLQVRLEPGFKFDSNSQILKGVRGI